MNISTKKLLSLVAVALSVSFATQAADISIVSGAMGRDMASLKEHVKSWEERTGNTVNIVSLPSSATDQFAQYRLWLGARNANIDVYFTDVLWAPQIDDHLVDLEPHTRDVVDDFAPSMIESQTTKRRLLALPMFAETPALYYRTDLLEKYGKKPPTSWASLYDTALEIQNGERNSGNDAMLGFVFQGTAEGLSGNALEWVASHGGGQVVEADGSISINNAQAALALSTAKTWIGTIAPENVLSYREQDAQEAWQTGNAVFMRNWPYAYGLGNGDDSVIRGRFDVVPLPLGEGGTRSAATLRSWNVAVSRYSRSKTAAVSLARHLSSFEIQKDRAINLTQLPTRVALYTDPEVAAAAPIILRWQRMFQNAVPRPSAPTRTSYNEVSANFWFAVHNTLSGKGTAEENLATLEGQLKRLRGQGWE